MGRKTSYDNTFHYGRSIKQASELVFFAIVATFHSDENCYKPSVGVHYGSQIPFSKRDCYKSSVGVRYGSQIPFSKRVFLKIKIMTDEGMLKYFWYLQLTVSGIRMLFL